MTELAAASLPTQDQPEHGVDPGLAEALREADARTADALRAAVARDRIAAAPLVQVAVAGLPVADLTRTEVVDRLVDALVARRPTTAFALHVGGLLSRRDRAFQAAMQSADLVYADGVSIVRLARMSGATRIERAATTDIGIDLLERVTAPGAPRLRIALVGGPQGLAERAGAGLAERFAVDVVHVDHGYHGDWTGPLAALTASGADLVLVGLGAPREMAWVQRHRAAFADALVLTCGGWFGFLAGEETRAPQVVQTLGLEWVWRWVQQPRRLARRYLLGAGLCLRLATEIRVRRAVSRLLRRSEPATP